MSITVQQSNVTMKEEFSYFCVISISLHQFDSHFSDCWVRKAAAILSCKESHQHAELHGSQDSGHEHNTTVHEGKIHSYKHQFILCTFSFLFI